MMRYRLYEPLIKLSEERNKSVSDAFAEFLNECDSYNEAAEKLGITTMTLRDWRNRLIKTVHVPINKQKTLEQNS